ncbi:MAG: RelA/SpoT domain-containing protein [Ruminococcus sp.]|jgi:ppGpp synthetase/RelA/SpoT-type nucleotidyltranferase|nr:RelA/SpoT domain-containing protein [Ruminococcus sp.]
MNFSNNQINKAGKILAFSEAGADVAAALDTINAWRSKHRYATDVFRELLMEKARAIDINFVFASRLKKIDSIKEKLRREPNMQLSGMQDIGGCRLIFSRIEDVYEMVNALLSMGGTWYPSAKHILKRKTDYIENPRNSGYRSYHMVYEYHNGSTVAENLKIEIQIRTYIQHIWATSVESASIIAKAPLKASKGAEYWLEFFRLVSSYFALQERKPLVPDTPLTKSEIVESIRAINRQHNILSQLDVLNLWIKRTEPGRITGEFSSPYFLLLISEDKENKAEISSIQDFDIFDVAYNAYVQAEKNIGNNAVLVSTNSAETLRRAYPNYFIDIDNFISILRNLLF